MRILIIDDDAIFLRQMEKNLSLENYSTYSAASGETALAILKENEVDLILMDLKMPGLSGVDLIKKIREIGCNSIIIMITGYGTIESAVQTTRAGAYDYILKPFNFPILLEKIKEVNGAQGPCFLSVEDIIDYIESGDWTLKDLVFRIQNTLKNGYDLKCVRKMERTEVYKKLDTERDYQDLRWGERRRVEGTPDEEKPVAEWINYIEYHVSAAKNEVYHLNTEEALAHVRKVAALAVRCLELHGCPDRVIPEELLEQE